MNLHAVVRGAVTAVNPDLSAQLLLSAGSRSLPSAQRTPLYQTPNAFTGSVANGLLTATAVTQGVLAPGQTLSDLTGALAPGTRIVAQSLGAPGGPGEYVVQPGDQAVPPESMTGALVVPCQAQAMTERDLRQVEGLNLQGVLRKFYFYGRVAGVVRSRSQGGDLVVIAAGVNAGTWLTRQVLEQWEGWCSVCATLQEDS